MHHMACYACWALLHVFDLAEVHVSRAAFELQDCSGNHRVTLLDLTLFHADYAVGCRSKVWVFVLTCQLLSSCCERNKHKV